jgi:HSP20 family protein
MANIVRKSGSEGVAFDPYSVMREMLNWDPFRELTPYFSQRATPVQAFSPAFEVKETAEGYVFRADVPGVAEKDLEMTLTQNRLTISGKREAEERKEGETFFAYERAFGSFTRTFTLPDGIDGDHVRADLKDGVLTVIVPKRAETQPRKISVGVGGEKTKT